MSVCLRDKAALLRIHTPGPGAAAGLGCCPSAGLSQGSAADLLAAAVTPSARTRTAAAAVASPARTLPASAALCRPRPWVLSAPCALHCEVPGCPSALSLRPPAIFPAMMLDSGHSASASGFGSSAAAHWLPPTALLPGRHWAALLSVTEMAAPPQRKLAGLMAATFTPLSAQGEINLAVIEPYIEYLVEKQGVRSVFVNGTTGESLSLSVEERKKLAEEWCQRGKGKLDQVIVHVGCLSLKESQELAQHAADTGADGIAVISPCFFKPVEKDSLRQFLQQVAAVAPQLPFYYYHIPGLTGVHLKAMDILQDIEESIPSFQGLKFSGSDLMDFGQCVHHSPPHWPMLYGMDEQLLAALVMGAHGAVGRSVACRPSNPAPAVSYSPLHRSPYTEPCVPCPFLPLSLCPCVT
ncbi:NPL lyase, partial [Amia calva]|nr:NPL lyase [Amia calva]